MFSYNFEIFENGHLDYIGGTSASTPAMAGLFSLINEARLKQGMSPLGWLTPTLYGLAQTNPEVFQDITAGDNSYGACSGFQAQPGWDGVTGWGPINFTQMYKVLTS